MTSQISSIPADAAGNGNGTPWPALPEGIRTGVAGLAGHHILVGLGSAGSGFWGLDMEDRGAGWRARAPFPGLPVDGAAAAMAGGRLYVFSGAGKAGPEETTPVVRTDAHVYDPYADSWQRLMTVVPVGLLGASAHALDADRIAFFGGYDKGRFDTYLRDLAGIDKVREPERWQAHVDSYMGMAPPDYRWNTRVPVYTISTNAWSDLGANPYPATTGAALVAEGGVLSLINGEIKPGLRTPYIAEIACGNGSLHWSRPAPLPPLPGDARQEGLAGAFAGMSNGALIVAGGVNFPGARANAEAGRWYAHKGLTKTWRTEIFARVGGVWRLAGHLPHGLAYGASFSTDAGIVLLGGEDGAMEPRREALVIRWTGTEATVTG